VNRARAGRCLAFALATGAAGASGACGPQDWYFDGDAAVAVLDANLGSEAEAADDENDTLEAGPADVAFVDGGPDVSSAPDVSQTCSVDGDCTADAPLCDRSTGTCVRCESNGDCSDASAGPACDLSSGRCVPCTTDRQCSSPLARCDSTAHACVRCLTSADCGRESFCTQATHACTSMI